MIVLGACSNGDNPFLIQKTSNHDVGAYIVTNVLKLIDKNYSTMAVEKEDCWLYKYGDHYYAIHSKGVNLLYRSINTLCKLFPKERIMIVIDDFALQKGKYKISQKFVNTGHNAMFNIELFIKPSIIDRICMLRIGIAGQGSLDLCTYVLSPVSHTVKVLIQNLSAIFFYNISQLNKLPDFIQGVKREFKKVPVVQQ